MISIIPIISASSTEILVSTTQLFSDLRPLLGIVIGIPFAFLVIEYIIDLASPDSTTNEINESQYIKKMKNGGWRTGFDFSDDEL